MMMWEGRRYLLGHFAILPGKFLGGLKRTTKYVNQDNLAPNRELNPATAGMRCSLTKRLLHIILLILTGFLLQP
jgi:hypothetical protein